MKRSRRGEEDEEEGLEEEKGLEAYRAIAPPRLAASMIRLLAWQHDIMSMKSSPVLGIGISSNQGGGWRRSEEPGGGGGAPPCNHCIRRRLKSLVGGVYRRLKS